MEKKTTSFRLKPKVQAALKKLADHWGKSVGDVIEGLVTFYERPEKQGFYIQDEKINEKILKLRDQDMANAGHRGRWVVNEAENLIEHFKTLHDLAVQAGDDSTAAQAENQIKRLAEEFGVLAKEEDWEED